MYTHQLVEVLFVISRVTVIDASKEGGQNLVRICVGVVLQQRAILEYSHTGQIGIFEVTCTNGLVSDTDVCVTILSLSKGCSGSTCEKQGSDKRLHFHRI